MEFVSGSGELNRMSVENISSVEQQGREGMIPELALVSVTASDEERYRALTRKRL